MIATARTGITRVETKKWIVSIAVNDESGYMSVDFLPNGHTWADGFVSVEAFSDGTMQTTTHPPMSKQGQNAPKVRVKTP